MKKSYTTRAQKFFEPDPEYRINQRRLAFLLGVAAIGLPIVLMFGAATTTCFYDTISHFYFSKFFGDIFVIGLAMMGTFLISYNGESGRENTFATLAGIAAFCVALFPTSGRGCEETSFSARIFADINAPAMDEPVIVAPATRLAEFFSLSDGIEFIHFASAGVLFLFLAFYALVVFTRIIPARHLDETGALRPNKAIRNKIYRVAGYTILAVIAILLGRYLLLQAGVNWNFWDQNNVTFFLETIALWAFGISWMVKGRFLGRALCDPDELNENGAKG